MGQFTDLTGRRFGRWTVLSRVTTNVKATIWRCRCDCGTIANVRGGHLCDGSTLSCGCYKRELTKKRLTKHGHRFRNDTKAVMREVIRDNMDEFADRAVAAAAKSIENRGIKRAVADLLKEE